VTTGSSGALRLRDKNFAAVDGTEISASATAPVLNYFVRVGNCQRGAGRVVKFAAAMFALTAVLNTTKTPACPAPANRRKDPPR